MKFNKTLNAKAYNRFLVIEKELHTIHNNFYNYSESVYSGYKKPMNIQCPDHGKFALVPKKHFEGQMCPICSQIKTNGRISLSTNNLKTHKTLVISYLNTEYPEFSFSNFKIINSVYIFECPKHGKIRSTKIKCKECITDKNNQNKTNTLIRRLKKRTEKIILAEPNKLILQCKHGINEYNSAQIYGAVIRCELCAKEQNRNNRINTEEFIVRAINRVGNKYKISETTYIDASTPVRLQCEKHGDFYVSPINIYKGTNCPNCGRTNISSAENSIADFLKQHNIPIRQSNRILIKPLEIDILTENFGIEYDGILWHSIGKHKSEKFNNYINESIIKKKHIKKTELCEQKDVQLFHIFENEWNNKQEIWKSMLLSKCNISTRIFARKCEIKELLKKEYKDFCNINHMQGACSSSVRIGLFHNNQLVSAMGFSKARFNNNYQYELIRFCSLLNTTVVGGASKLLKYFELNYKPESIISYANRRWSTGNLYEQIGFEFIKNTPPNYFYFRHNDDMLFSRNKFQKHKLKEKLKLFDSELTETENMYNNNYRKIYDSGNKVYIKKYK